MTEKPLFLTCGLSGEFAGMVRDHESRHREYCDRQGYEYLAADPGENYSPKWFRIDLILEAMRSGRYTHVFWIDADAFVADLSVDLRTALPAHAWLGMRIIGHCPWAGDVFHWQTGCFYVRVTPDSLRYFEHVRAMEHEGSPDDQDAMMRLLLDEPDYQSGLVTLRYPWNYCGHCDPHERKPIVCGFHGYLPPALRRLRMQDVATQYPY